MKIVGIVKMQEIQGVIRDYREKDDLIGNLLIF
jgi:hypothetical protein